MYLDDHEVNILDDPSLARPTAPNGAEMPGAETPAAEVYTPPVFNPPAAVEPPAKVKKRHPFLRALALVLVCALVGGGAGFGGALLAGRLFPGRGLPAAVPETVIYEGTGTPVTVSLSKEPGRKLSYAEVYASNVNSVVGIITQTTTNVWGQTVASASAGSGFVLTQDGYIVTNYHVVKDSTSIAIQFKNGDKYDAKLVGGEEDEDVAVLKVNATGLTPVRLGTSGDMVVGEEVVAIGNPLGEMTYSVTHGIISALDRPFVMPDDSGTVINVLQTDAAINLGNSGGPLFNMYGQVIGITNGKDSNNGSTKAAIEGICFAIPIDDVKDILTDLIEHGYVTGKPYVGVTLSTANAREAAKYGRAGGAYVQSVVPGSPAEAAGLKKGDIITAVDDEEVDGHAAFIELKNKRRAGDSVTLTVDRDGRFITVGLTYGEQQPVDPLGDVPATDIQGDWEGGQGSQGADPDLGPQDFDWRDYGFSSDPFSWFGW